jgi:hypothetical protein
MNVNDVFAFEYGDYSSNAWLLWDTSKKANILHRKMFYSQQEKETLLTNILWRKYGHEIMVHVQQATPAD